MNLIFNRITKFYLFLSIAIVCLCGCQYTGKNVAAPARQSTPCVVLALPASGPYSSVTAKINRGADLAISQLKSSGTSVRLEKINTEAPDWLAKLEALPEYCAVVGGPIQDKNYMEARNARALERRVFFSFLPNLSGNDEGKLAWRFFPSPADQVNALVSFGINELNIRSYGAFYPDDTYGERMTNLFSQNLASRHIPLAKASYNPHSPSTWSDAVSVLIQPITADDGKTPLPQTTFEAIFLPDSWKHLDMINQSLMYNGEDRLVLMGTTLWEQNLNGKQIANPRKYALAVFPGAWNQQLAPKALQGPGNDLWVALGYDFINFAVNSGIDQRLTSDQVTARAQQAASIIRAIAPLHWNNGGIASEKLYLFQVSGNGMKPLDVEEFRRSLVNAKERAMLRLQGNNESPLNIQEPVQGMSTIQESKVSASEQKPLITAPEQGGTNAPAQAAPTVAPPIQGNMSTTPQPSYKLRLPGQK